LAAGTAAAMIRAAAPGRERDLSLGRRSIKGGVRGLKGGCKLVLEPGAGWNPPTYSGDGFLRPEGAEPSESRKVLYFVWWIPGGRRSIEDTKKGGTAKGESSDSGTSTGETCERAPPSQTRPPPPQPVEGEPQLGRSGFHGK